MKENNSIRYAGRWIAVGLILAVVLPTIIWLVWRVFLLVLVLAGIAVLAFFLLRLWLAFKRDYGRVPHYRKNPAEDVRFDPETQEAVIRASVCTGEKVAGFKDIATGHFTEVMVIRTPEDEVFFMKTYGIDEMRTEY